MTKFALDSTSVFSIGGNAITCVTDITIDESVDDLISQCFGSDSVKAHVLAGINITGSFNIELENYDVTMLGYLAPKTSGALILQPAGPTVGNIALTSTNLQITGRTPIQASRSGLGVASGTFVLDDLTIAAIT